MRIDELTKLWNEINTPGVFQGYDSSHPLELFFGLDINNKKDFILLMETFPEKIPPSSRSIQTFAARREDGKFVIHFQLIQGEDSDVFIRLCYDLSESTRNTEDKKDGIKNFLNRYLKWKMLLDRENKGKLSVSEIKGLLGELLFIEKYLSAKLGINKALTGWIGPEGADRDFVLNDSWYEVKSVDPGSVTVHISSLEQLDIDYPGQLVLMVIEKTAPSDSKSISLPEQIARLRSNIGYDMDSVTLLDTKLAESGYFYDSSYDEDKFVFHAIRLFNVSKDFPRIRRKDVASGIVKLEYELAVNAITGYEIK